MNEKLAKDLENMTDPYLVNIRERLKKFNEDQDSEDFGDIIDKLQEAHDEIARRQEEEAKAAAKGKNKDSAGENSAAAATATKAAPGEAVITDEKEL